MKGKPRARRIRAALARAQAANGYILLLFHNSEYSPARLMDANLSAARCIATIAKENMAHQDAKEFKMKRAATWSAERAAQRAEDLAAQFGYKRQGEERIPR